MKVAARDVREFFKNNNYSPQDMIDGDLAPYALAESLNALMENERLMAEVKLATVLAFIEKWGSRAPTDEELYVARNEIRAVKDRL